jgi:hypothetical protein
MVISIYGQLANAGYNYKISMNHIIRIRLLLCCSLIYSFATISCRNESANEIELGWEDNKVATIFIPDHWVDYETAESMKTNLLITLSEPGSPPIIGDYFLHNESIGFTPAIPFTKGMKYTVLYKGRILKEIQMPESRGIPSVTAIYPNADSLPENLLKIYIHFSEKMEEGVSAQHVFLIKNGVDTLRNVFLDLQPELWNQDRTMLTLWLNPGRIKRDLIPNREEGPPLEPGAHYQLRINSRWRNAFGDSLIATFQKNFITVARDTIAPDINHWTISTPGAETTDVLVVNFKEPLDYLVAINAVYVTDNVGHELPGTIELARNERLLWFTPANQWKKGRYKLRIEPRVEDLAGNNLERLFDVDLANPKSLPQAPKVSKVYYKEFEIR